MQYVFQCKRQLYRVEIQPLFCTYVMIKNEISQLDMKVEFNIFPVV